MTKPGSFATRSRGPPSDVAWTVTNPASSIAGAPISQASTAPSVMTHHVTASRNKGVNESRTFRFTLFDDNAQSNAAPRQSKTIRLQLGLWFSLQHRRAIAHRGEVYRSTAALEYHRR